MQIGCRAKNGGRQRGARSLAKAHAEVQKRALAQVSSSRGCANSAEQ